MWSMRLGSTDFGSTGCSRRQGLKATLLIPSRSRHHVSVGGRPKAGRIIETPQVVLVEKPPLPSKSARPTGRRRERGCSAWSERSTTCSGRSKTFASSVSRRPPRRREADASLATLVARRPTLDANVSRCRPDREGSRAGYRRRPNVEHPSERFVPAIVRSPMKNCKFGSAAVSFFVHLRWCWHADRRQTERFIGW